MRSTLIIAAAIALVISADAANAGSTGPARVSVAASPAMAQLRLTRLSTLRFKREVLLHQKRKRAERRRARRTARPLG